MSTAAVLIFIVEDEGILREVLKDGLAEGGFDVAEAINGDEAMATLEVKGTSFRALVTDIKVGSKTTGWGIARRAREIVPEIPVVYLTTAGSEEWSANGVPNSVLVQKPYAVAQVLTAISQLLNTGAPTPTAG